MPRPELFDGSEEYYSTLFHELTHSTGQALGFALDRLDRRSFRRRADVAEADALREIAELAEQFSDDAPRRSHRRHGGTRQRTRRRRSTRSSRS